MERKIRLLNPDEIEVRINQVKGSGASALLYKTARVDYEILDETFGIGNWQVDYSEIKGNLYCTISIWDEDKGQWIKKTNCGVESREDGNGNEKKGEASDALKRAGTVVGIGRELYSSPFIWLNVKTKQEGNRYTIVDENGKTSFDKYAVSEIGYDDKRKINRLVIVNQKTGAVVYKYGADKPVKPPKKPAKPAELASTVPDTYDAKAAYTAFKERHGLTDIAFTAWRDKAAGDPETGVEKKPFKELSPQEWASLLGALETLSAKGFFNE